MGSPFLNTGTTLASFHCTGTIPCASDALNRVRSLGVISSAQSFKSLVGIPSVPWALLASTCLSAAVTSSVVRVTVLRLSFSVTAHAGVGLSHFLKMLRKNSLKVVALALGSVISILLEIR